MRSNHRTRKAATAFAFAAVATVLVTSGCASDSDSPPTQTDAAMDTPTRLTHEASSAATTTETPSATTSADHPTTTASATATTTSADRTSVTQTSADRPAVSVPPGQASLTLGGRDFGAPDDTFGPCGRAAADAASLTTRFGDGTILAFEIIGGELSVLEVTNPADGIDLDLPGSGVTFDIDGDIVTIDGQFTSPDDAFTVVANCPLAN